MTEESNATVDSTNPPTAAPNTRQEVAMAEARGVAARKKRHTRAAHPRFKQSQVKRIKAAFEANPAGTASAILKAAHVHRAQTRQCRRLLNRWKKQSSPALTETAKAISSVSLNEQLEGVAGLLVGIVRANAISALTLCVDDGEVSWTYETKQVSTGKVRL